MNFERQFLGKLLGKKDTTESAKKEGTQELTSETFRKKLGDPYWLPQYGDIRKVVDSFTDKYGLFLLGKAEELKWYDVLYDNKGTPIFEVWTKEYIERFSNYLTDRVKALGGTKENPATILEVGAGDGKLSYFLTQQLKKSGADTIKLIATNYDNEVYQIKSAYKNVEKIPEKEALKKYNPSIVICSWMLNRVDWTPDFRNTKSVQEYILIGPQGPCGKEETWWSPDGFEVILHPDLDEVQLSRLDIVYNPKKSEQNDHISRTTSFIRKKEYSF